PSHNVQDHLPKTAKETNSNLNAPNRKQHAQATNCPSAKPEDGDEPEVSGAMCRALSRRLDSEELKRMGNEEFKQGNFAEALALYDRAILIDPEKASYWSNKAAALTGLGKLIEAVAECREAVRLEPSYHKAHLRLGTLYLRLGEAERALHHYKLSRNEASSADISRAQALQTHLSKCSEARRLKDWHSVVKETQLAVSSGADSSPQVFSFKAEALLMLHKHEEAETALNSAPRFDIDASTKLFGAMKSAFTLMVRAQVDMTAGRFEDALSMANRAARLDTSSGEAGGVARKARVVATARATGNDFFKASKFEEACVAYGEGLNHDTNNAILMCNRAACHSKLGQWEKAIKDCNVALNMRPSYTKARLRRADCYAKLEEWEASIKDYEALLVEIPEDEEVKKALHEAQTQLRKKQGEGVKNE
ncbi:inactive TPR repeat-containing thioredoxin TTL3-like, partial [Asparagus officinalis]|uniref:inactive TPR repeat-containing thioredoxin TTL3-like n=1 Tax=Asparagus officinalis TaxID=4686 RepID=UPI00098E1C83